MLNEEVGGAYQKIDGAAHTVVSTVIAHHRAVVKETLEEAGHQGNEVLHLGQQLGASLSAL